MHDTALLLVETQSEWLEPGGRLRERVDDPARVSSTRAALLRLLEAARAAHLLIVHAHLRFSPDYVELGTGAFGLRRAIRTHRLWTDHGAEAATGFSPHSGELVIHRNGASAFAGSGLATLLQTHGVRKVIVAGAATHVCVLATITQAHDLGLDVVVPREASLAFTEAQHQLALDEVAPHFAWVKPLAATLEHLERRATVVARVNAFLDGLAQGDVEQVAPCLHPELVVEGYMNDAWQRWDRATYLERVATLAGALRDAPPPAIERIDLVGGHAEVSTRVEVPGGHFDDRLSWTHDASEWHMRHKTFQFRPAIQAHS